MSDANAVAHRTSQAEPTSTPILRPQGFSGAGFTVGLFANPRGVTRLRPLPDHLLSIHVGRPVHATCRFAGRGHRGLYAHGDIDIVPAGLSGAWEDEAPGTSLAVRLSPALLRRAATGLGQHPEHIVVAPRVRLRDRQLEHICWALRAELEDGFPGGRLYTESLGLALATRLLRLDVPVAAPAHAGRCGLSERQLRRVIDYVEEHLDRDLSLEHLAEVAGVSASHLKAAFKQALGLPVHQYVIRRRVERARALLLAGQLATGQVALETGFAHQSHMARWMRRLLGVTPTDVARSRR